MFNQVQITSPMLPKGIKIDRAYYDEDYYNGRPKSNWGKPYTWENMQNTFYMWAAFVLTAFPESKSFLNVGCARGFLERAIIETCARNGKKVPEWLGFDISPHAIDTAEEKAKPFIMQSDTDSFIFTRSFETLLCFDVFEHLTEKQLRSFLTRARDYVEDCGCFYIATDSEENRLEPSHITLENREWWNALFIECGWIQNQETREFEAMATKFLPKSDSEIFIYLSGR